MSPTRKPKPPDKGAPPEHKPSRKVALDEVMRSLQDLVSNELATEPVASGAVSPKKRRRTDQARPTAPAAVPPPDVGATEQVESITLETLPGVAPEIPAAPEPVISAAAPLPVGGLQQELPHLDLPVAVPVNQPEAAAPTPPDSIPAAVAETTLGLSEENWDDIPVLEETVDLSEEIDTEAAGHDMASSPTALPPAAAARRLAIQVAARLNVELRKSGKDGLNSAVITQLAKMLEEALAKAPANVENVPSKKH